MKNFLVGVVVVHLFLFVLGAIGYFMPIENYTRVDFEYQMASIHYLVGFTDYLLFGMWLAFSGFVNIVFLVLALSALKFIGKIVFYSISGLGEHVLAKTPKA